MRVAERGVIPRKSRLSGVVYMCRGSESRYAVRHVR